MLIAIFFLLIILAVVVYIAMQRRSAVPPAPAEQVVAPEEILPTPDPDTPPDESQSDEVTDIQNDLDTTVVNEDDTGYTDVNTDLNSL
jgi:hypothetical protein